MLVKHNASNSARERKGIPLFAIFVSITEFTRFLAYIAPFLSLAPPPFVIL